MAKVSPQTASYRQICRMPRDNFGAGNFSIMTDGVTVWLSEQKVGEDRRQHLELSKKRFNQLLRWYQKEVEFRP